MRKLWAAVLVALLLALLLAPGAAAGGDALFAPLGDTGALLVRSGGRALLLGGGVDASRVAEAAALAGDVDGVAAVCAHPEHVASARALAEACGAALTLPGESVPLDGASWQGNALILASGGARCAFGDEAAEDAVAFRCDGALVPFEATTRESAVNIRREPDAGSAKAGQLSRGETLTVEEAEQNTQGELWYAVRAADGAAGYVRADLLTPLFAEKTALAAAEKPKSEQQYIGNKNSKVFHYPTCNTLPHEKNRVYFDDREDAINDGYRPCKNCNP